MQSRLSNIIPEQYRNVTFWLDDDKVPFLDWLTDDKKLLPFLLMQALHIARVRRIALDFRCQFFVDADDAFLLQCTKPQISSLPGKEQSALTGLLSEAAAELFDAFFPWPQGEQNSVSYSLKIYLLSYSQYLSERYAHKEHIHTSALISYLFNRWDHALYHQPVKLSEYSQGASMEASSTQNCAPTLKQILCSPSASLKPFLKRIQHIIKVKGGSKPIDDTALLAAIMATKPLRNAFKEGLQVSHDVIAPQSVNELLAALTDAVDMQLCCNGENDGKSWFDIQLSEVMPAHLTAGAADILQRCCEFDDATQTVHWAQHAINQICRGEWNTSSSIFGEFITFNQQFDDPRQKRFLLTLLEQQMDADIVGQSEVKKALLAGLRQCIEGVALQQRGPVFIYGASGVGKTSLAKVFAQTLNVHLADSYALQIINMEQFYHKNAALQLFGAGLQFNAANLGTLTTPGEFQAKRIIVFDEIEKAHPNTINSLLTLLSEHEARDSSTNRLVDFSESIFIFTSNVGQHNALEHIAMDYRSELATAFSPEFISRIARGSVARALPLEEAEVITLAKQLAYELAFELDINAEGDLARAICMIAGELNPRAMLGAVTKLRSEIRNEVNAAYYDELLRINGLLIEFEGGEADLAAFVNQYHSRVWQAGFSIRLRCAEQVGTLALVCELPKPVISLQDIQCPFMHFVSDSDCRFADLIGNDAVISQIKRLVCSLNERCSSLHEANIAIGHTLLVGPPGTGKTHLARAIASDFQGVFIQVNASELTIGDADKNLKTLFTAAKKYAPSIVFIDEIDAIASKRQAETKSFNLMVNSLLTALDGFNGGLDSVMIIGATNHPDYLDDAVVRPGRLNNRLTLNFPTHKELKNYVECELGDALTSVDCASVMDAIVGKLHNRPVALVDNILQKARALISKQGDIGAALIAAYINQTAGEPEADGNRSEEQTRLCAYHEAGHALVIAEVYSPDDVLAVDIRRRADTESLVLFANLQARYAITRATVKKQLQVLLAGRAAEQVLLNDPDQLSRSDASDIRSATELAKKAIGQWGLSSTCDMVDKSQFSMSEAELQLEVGNWMTDAYNSAFAICEKKRPVLMRLAESLIKSQVLYFSDIQRLLSVSKCSNSLH